MKKQIVHLSIHQTSKVIAVMHTALVTVLVILPIAIGYWLQQQVLLGIAIFLLIPLLVCLLMYIGYAIACWFFNLLLPWIGGIEFEVVDRDDQGGG